jgi:hypothetical protein
MAGTHTSLGDWGSRVQISALRPKNPLKIGIFGTFDFSRSIAIEERKRTKQPKSAQRVPKNPRSVFPVRPKKSWAQNVHSERPSSIAARIPGRDSSLVAATPLQADPKNESMNRFGAVGKRGSQTRGADIFYSDRKVIRSLQLLQERFS